MRLDEATPPEPAPPALMAQKAPASAERVFETGAATHTGKVRQANEDRFVVVAHSDPDIGDSGVWAVADGMGGHEGGVLASTALAAALSSIGAPASAPDLLARLEDRVIRANRELKAMGAQRGGIIGSTLAVVLAFQTNYACVWAGDSRIYRLRGGVLEQLSRDHTEAQELVDKGVLSSEEARTWPRRNVITRAIGVHDDPELELDHGVLEAGDTFLICSDGLTGHVADEEIAAVLARAAPQEACDALVALTLERGAADNVTVVVLRFRGARPG